MIIDLSSITSITLLALRIVVAIIFLSSGWSHAQNPQKRGESIGMPKGATLILGLVEIIGALSVAFGIWIQIGAALLILSMLGAIYKKIFVWNLGFFDDESLGWHYDLMLLCANFIFLTEGGRLVLVG